MNREHRRRAEKNILTASDRLHRKYSSLEKHLKQDLPDEERISVEAEMVVISKAIDIAAEQQLTLRDMARSKML